MKEVKVPVHSFIDVITNSSTEIFSSTNDNTVKFARELISTILKMSGSEKTVDELFEFEMAPGGMYLDRWCDYIYEEEFLSDEDEEAYDKLDWEGKQKQALEAFNACVKVPSLRPEGFGDIGDGQTCDNLVVRSKADGAVALDVLGMFSKMVDTEEYYN